MLFDTRRPHAFRERRVRPGEAEDVAGAERDAALRRAGRRSGLEAWAVHASADGLRVMVVEAWSSVAAFRADAGAREPGTDLFRWAATDGRVPTPVADADAGAIVIDVFPVWRPLVGPVSVFNIRNGRAFGAQPGCISTTVLRGVGAGRIATYARWRAEADFLAAFAAATGRKAQDTDGVNRAAARMTLGLIRPDYHAYRLVDHGGDA